MAELARAFEPAGVEARIYEAWERGGAFAAHPESAAAPFAVMIPPPNVTGSLHVGHALTMTLQDVLVRYRRMQGRDALWQPGTDHAGIATQMVVERLLDTQKTSRQALGRDAFTARVWQWKAQSGGAIVSQLRRLGASADWSRERFTMDAGLSIAVREVFVRLAEEGLIYRDKRLVNWDPKFQTALSDIEVESREVKGSLWHLRYPVEGGGVIVVATTRPETMLGDMAVAVHPDDERYKALVGRFVILPLTGRRIPIVADAYSDPEKGSGAVKITPAHDFNDFEVGRRHGLDAPSVLDAKGHVSLAEIGEVPAFVEELAGLERFAARRAIVTELERLELLEKTEPHAHAVPHGDRSGVPVEPRLTVQWYCDASKLAAPAIAAVENGAVRFHPKSWENTFFAWMRNIQPWCISRQLWWGHRIPAWYGPDGTVFVARNEAAAQAKADAHYGRAEPLCQDEDVLDTWFSSGLWPFSTLGWPEKTPELAKYYPTDTLVTGFDIIFFWVARMVMFGLHFMGDVPFRHVMMHGLVRDERGQKMSKSKGNVVDPLSLIDAYGADALRYTVAAAAAPGRDAKVGAKLVETNRGFVTKIWNAARFLEINGVVPQPGFDVATATLSLSQWIVEAAHEAGARATQALDDYRTDDYARICYHFVWDDFCDWFIEFAKPEFTGGDAAEIRAVAAYVLGFILRLLHPLMPFVTEEIWDHFGYGEAGSLIRAPWPQAAPAPTPLPATHEVTWIKDLISNIRAVRSEMNVAPAMKSPVLFSNASDSVLARAHTWHDAIARMARASEIGPLTGAAPRQAANIVVGGTTIILPLAGLIDLDAERARLTTARAKTAAELHKVQRKLQNDAFTSRAPEDVLEEHREREENFRTELTKLDEAIKRTE